MVPGGLVREALEGFSETYGSAVFRGSRVGDVDGEFVKDFRKRVEGVGTVLENLDGASVGGVNEGVLGAERLDVEVNIPMTADGRLDEDMGDVTTVELRDLLKGCDDGISDCDGRLDVLTVDV